MGRWHDPAGFAMCSATEENQTGPAASPSESKVPTLAALWVFRTQSKEARFALVTAGSLHVLLAATLPGNQP